jgi:hypothetical protein
MSGEEQVRGREEVAGGQWPVVSYFDAGARKPGKKMAVGQ